MTNEVKKWKELSREMAFQKYNRKIEKVVYKFPDGTERDFYIKKEGPVVCVLALTKEKQVILAKQYRPGPGEILLELPGGGIEKGEIPKQAIERELLEETGYKGSADLVVEALDSAYSMMRRFCFVATDCEKVAEPQNTSSEICETALLSLEEFRNLLRSGKMTDIEVGYLGLDYLGLL